MNDVIASIRRAIVPVHPDGYKFIAIFAVVSILLGWWADWLGTIGWILTVWCIYFFRDPVRVTPEGEGLVVAPGDGRIAMIAEVVPPAALGLGETPHIRISTFLSVFDVHINRLPVSGRVAAVHYVKGLFLNAELDKASEDNERNLVAVETAEGVRIGMVQIAGLVARRILSWVNEGQQVRAGERMGLIRFGSRVDVFLPLNASVLVAVGQRAIGGETVLAELGTGKPARGGVAQ